MYAYINYISDSQCIIIACGMFIRARTNSMYVGYSYRTVRIGSVLAMGYSYKILRVKIGSHGF